MVDPQSKDLRAFPVHSMYAGKNGCPSFVRWEALSEEWANKNHDQTLTRLAERGGLDPTEIVANLERRAYHDRPLSVATAIKLIEPYACENPRVEAKSSKPVSPLADRLGFIAKYLERPGASPEEIVMSVTVEEAAERFERLRAALMEARNIFMQLGYAEDDKVSNTASRGVYVTAKALADSPAAAPESRDG